MSAIHRYESAVSQAVATLRSAQDYCLNEGDSFLAEELGDLIDTLTGIKEDVSKFHAVNNALCNMARSKTRETAQ